ncbi:MAG: hypothetical protein C5B59_07590 [Bacteroidetes bacterium]|nr:MAG: hypothetical protein C5B59_07590 [Bacteroidota bacterium]
MIANATRKIFKIPSMHKFLMALFLMINVAYGQPTYRLSTDSSKVIDIRERLVQLALQNPTYEMADHMVALQEYTVKLAKGNWLNILVASANVNEFTVNQLTGSSTGAQYFYPKYNIGLNVPMDLFSRQRNNVRIAKENYMIAQAQKNDRFRQIKAEVLTHYEDYLMGQQMLDLQAQVTQDAFTLYKRSEKDFQDGIIKLEEFNKGYENWAAAQTKKLTLQRNVNVTKIEIEKMIGVKFDDVLRQIK